MAETDGRVVFGISGDASELKRTLHETTSEIQRESGKWDDAVQNSTDSMADAFGRAFNLERIKNFAIQAGKWLLQFGKEAVDLASDLEEVQNVVDVTFGQNAGVIDEWAKKARENFGLTELQAKRFASTIGATLKSTGVSGQQVVQMSQDLAGLAADMASFYNLDFDEAFQKIRSGISGETEPLKQLGIDMSVASLQAFALSQGIETAFDKLSASQQAMLRYQYLMQATSDAQGDFARTQDGLANSLRSLETSFDTIKSKIGEVLMPAVADAVRALEGLINEMLPKEDFRTVLDQFNDIDIETAQKLEEIGQIKDEADMLLGMLVEISGTTLDSGQFSEFVDGVSGSMGDLNDEVERAKTANYAQTIGGVVDAFNQSKLDGQNAEAWDTLMGALAGNVEGIAALTGMDVTDVEAWLSRVGEAAQKLDPNTAEGWNQLMALLTQGLPGVSLNEDGTLDTSVLSQMGEQADQYGEYLAALGFDTDSVVDKQALWLEICKRLVATIPGLSDIINTETGEVRGGAQAVRDYIDEWSAAQEKAAYLKDLQRRQEALDEAYIQRYELGAQAMVARQRANARSSEYQAIYGTFGEEDLAGYAEWKEWLQGKFGKGFRGVNTEQYSNRPDLQRYAQLYNAEMAWIDANNEATEAEERATQYTQDYEAAVAGLNEEKQAIIATYGEDAVAADGAAQATQGLTEAGQELAEETLNKLGPALEELADYYEAVHTATQRQVESTIKGLEKIETPAQRARREFQQLNQELTGEEFEIRFAAEGNVPTAQSILAGLESQSEYIKQYQEYLELAKQAGVSEDLLADLSDGSVESYDYLAALSGASEDEIAQINAAYEEVNAGKETFVDALTQQKLAADETFQSIVDACDQMIIDLDMADGAYDSLSATVQGMADGIAAQMPGLQEQVDAVLAQLNRLNSFGKFGMSGNKFTFGASGRLLDGSFETGADYIPFDGFLAQLHEGESVLTAEEARIWRAFKYGNAGHMNSIDYDAVGSAIGANVHAGGSVYLDGQTVGRVISASQANSYRRLERSGWQQ